MKKSAHGANTQTKNSMKKSWDKAVEKKIKTTHAHGAILHTKKAKHEQHDPHTKHGQHNSHTKHEQHDSHAKWEDEKY